MKRINIPQYKHNGDWEVNYSFKRLVEQVEKWVKGEDCNEFQKLEMNPDFQRGHVWVEGQQVKFIEALLSGVLKMQE